MSTLAPPPPAAGAAGALPDTPYRGIEPFRLVDEPIFFGRDAERHKLLRSVTIYRGVLLYGDSGAGKSSLINAGLIPLALAEGFVPERVRVQPRAGEELIVERISTSPGGGAPYLPSLFAAEDGAARVVLSAEAFRAAVDGHARRHREAVKLSRDPAGRAALAPEEREALEAALQRRPLLVFDQFEELVTLFEEAPRGEALEEARAAQKAVLELLSVLLRDHTIPVKLLFAFRDDYLAKLNKLFVLAPDLRDQYLRLTPLATGELDDVVRGPFREHGEHFGEQIPDDVADALEEAILARSESGVLNLSEVQIACLRLWRSDDPRKLLAERRVEGLLEDSLSDALNLLSAELREPAVALLSRMVTDSGTRNVISEEDLLDGVHEDEGIARAPLEEALGALVAQTGLVRRERRHNIYVYEIISEFLVPWIHRRKIERAAEAERAERERKHRETRKKHRAYQIAAGGVLAAVIAGLVAWGLISAQNRASAAELQNKLAQNEALRAETARQRAERAVMVRTLEVIQRDTVRRALAARDSAVAVAAAAVRDRDSAVVERLRAERERDGALVAAARAERARILAVDARSAAERQRDDAVAARQAAEGDRDRAVAAQRTLEGERDRAVASLRTAEERLAQTSRGARQERDEAVREARADERRRAEDEIREARKDEEEAERERDRFKTRADSLGMRVEALEKQVARLQSGAAAQSPPTRRR